MLNMPSANYEFGFIHNTYISSIPTGRRGYDLIGQISNLYKSLVFYLNGTTIAKEYFKVLTETHTTISSEIRFDLDEGDSPTTQTAYLVRGGADVGFSLENDDEHYAFLRPGTWAACKEKLPLDNSDVIVFKQVFSPSGLMPKDCVSVRLLPECAELYDLPKGSLYLPKPIKPSHEHVINTHCYQNVKAIEWSKYGPGP